MINHSTTSSYPVVWLSSLDGWQSQYTADQWVGMGGSLEQEVDWGMVGGNIIPDVQM